MARNPYFKVSSRDSSLLQQLVKEQIQVFGFDVHYIFRKFQNLDALFGEDTISKFQKSFQVEMFVSNYEFYESLGRVIDKFGINLQDSVNLMVAKTRFAEESAKYGTDTIPQEGDLIYFPEYGGLFEIKYVNDRNSFFSYELNCERFRYNAEKLETEIPEVDMIEDNLVKSVRLFTLLSGVTFQEGETVYQGSSVSDSTYSATIIDYKQVQKTMKVSDETGTPNIALPLKGEDSGVQTTYTTLASTNEKYLDTNADDSHAIERERSAKDIIDFSEKDPFSEGNF
jgi:cupin superfamily acireductone dioxygenase involved in methionine salvage